MFEGVLNDPDKNIEDVTVAIKTIKSIFIYYDIYNGRRHDSYIMYYSYRSTTYEIELFLMYALCRYSL